MKLWLVGACTLFLFLPAALGLKCNYCISFNSWDDCGTRSKECLIGMDRCAKVYVKVGPLKLFVKDCVSSAGCYNTCKGKIGFFECDVSCCEGDNCNAGPAPRIRWYPAVDMRPGISDDSL